MAGRLVTVMLWVAPPPSFQPPKTNCVPGPLVCVVTTEMVCDPGERLRVCGAVNGAPPSTLACSPGGLV